MAVSPPLHAAVTPERGDHKHHACVQACAVMEFQSQQACTAAAMVSRGGSPCCATGYEGGCLRLFDLATASLAWTSQCHSSATALLAVELSSCGKELLTVARLVSADAC